MSRPPNRETANDTAKLIMHRLIARELARDSTLVQRARVQLGKMAVRFPEGSFVQDWEAVLRRPISEIAAVLTGRNQEARLARLEKVTISASKLDRRSLPIPPDVPGPFNRCPPDGAHLRSRQLG